jgi:predicted Rossmann fold nucleotide-binding protein DprA/Smf involved in DNA uptake
MDTALAAAISRGQVAICSPFQPDAPLTDTNARASRRLVAALADAVITMSAAEEVAMHDIAGTALRLGQSVYVWDADPADEIMLQRQQMLVEAGGSLVREMADVLDIVAGLTNLAASRSANAVGTGSPEMPAAAADAGSGTGTMDPDQVLALLSRTGHVPEALRKRLQQC